ncbi:MAG: hypothetical protein ACI39N_02615 [Lachnospiraceae bacterium]
MKRKICCILTAVLALSSILETETMAAGNPSLKEEVIYVNLENDGSVKEINVVNILTPEKGNLTDYGNYSSIRNMTTTDEITYQNGTVSATTDASKVYYEGRLEDTTIPWNIVFHYYLDNQEYPAKELAGKSGKLKITTDISKNESYSGTFFEDYALQATFSFDTNLVKNIEAKGATTANVGADKQLTYTILPGKETSIEITADVTDFSLDEISINAIRLNLDVDVDDTELMDEVTDLQDGVVELNDGAKELLDGSADMKSGAKDLDDGAVSIYDGVSSLSDGADDLSSGAETLRNGANELKSGAAELSSGTDELAGKVPQLTSGIGTLLSGSQELSQGLSTLVQNNDSLNGAMGQAAELSSAIQAAITAYGYDSAVIDPTSGMTLGQAAAALSMLMNGAADNGSGNPVPGLKDSVSGYTAGAANLATGAADLNGGLQELNSQTPALTEGITKLQQGADALESGTAALAEGAEKLYSGTGTLKDGVSELKSGAQDLKDGTGTLMDGANDLHDGVGELADGTQTLEDETSGMDEKVSDKIDKMLDDITRKDCEIVSFVSDKNTNIKSVQFVMKTDKIELQETEEETDDEEEPLGFFQKLKNLFVRKES